VVVVDSDRKGPSGDARVVVCLSLALLCGPVLLDLALSDRSRPFGYAAADSFYYLTIARNMARHGVPSFDGQHATNGFHPLWQLVAALLHFATEHLGVGRHTLLVLLLVNLALVAGGLWLLGRAITEKGRLSALFVLLPVGAYGLLVAPFWLTHQADLASSMEGPFPVYGTLWSYVNGMESGAVLFCFGLSTRCFLAYSEQPSRGRALSAGASLGALVLSRLDHVLIALPLLATLVSEARSRRRSGTEIVELVLVFAVPVALDVLVNVHWFGAAMPVSGALKTSFPVFTPLHLQTWVDLWKAGSQANLWTLQREASLIVPLSCACGYLAVTFRARRLGATWLLCYRPSVRLYERFLVPTAAGVILLAGYDILFVVDGPSSWYLPVSTLFVSLAVLALTDRAPFAVPAAGTGAVLGAVACLSLALFLKLERQPDYHAAYARFFWQDAPELRRHFGRHPPHILEIDDGIVNYALDTPAMSAGLALDPEGVDALKGGHLFDLAYERGFNCLSTLVYGSAAELAHDHSPAAAQRYAQARWGEDVPSYRFHLAFITRSASLAIVCADKP
jgi:hypothetical protein